MRNLVLAPINAQDAWEEIIKAKRGERKRRLLDLSPRVKTLYENYDSSRSNIETIIAQDWTAIESEDLIHCYESATEGLTKLKYIIEAAQPPASRRICHFCGENSVSDFEHYLPKDLFPEFSVCVFNLMPCCSQCNDKKLGIHLVANKRQIVHLYFDLIPLEKFVNVDIEFHKGEPVAVFSLEHHPNISFEMFSLLKNHYQRLGLLERYSEYASTEFAGIAISLQEHKIDNFIKVQEWLIEESNRWRRIQSGNHWRVVLYEKLAETNILKELSSIILLRTAITPS